METNTVSTINDINLGSTSENLKSQLSTNDYVSSTWTTTVRDRPPSTGKTFVYDTSNLEVTMKTQNSSLSISTAVSQITTAITNTITTAKDVSNSTVTMSPTTTETRTQQMSILTLTKIRNITGTSRQRTTSTVTMTARTVTLNITDSQTKKPSSDDSTTISIVSSILGIVA
ncbi:unnamed protein product, partial [Rotaria sordida]